MAPAELATRDVVRDREVAALMGGSGRITVVLPPDTSIDASDGLLYRGETRLRALEASWSRFISTGEIAAINRAAGRATPVSPETQTLVSAMVKAWHLTDGVVDASVLPDVIAAGYVASVLTPSQITTLSPRVSSRGRMI